MAPAGGSICDFVWTLVTIPIVSPSRRAITPNTPAIQILPVTDIAKPAIKAIWWNIGKLTIPAAMKINENAPKANPNNGCSMTSITVAINTDNENAHKTLNPKFCVIIFLFLASGGNSLLNSASPKTARTINPPNRTVTPMLSAGRPIMSSKRTNRPNPITPKNASH